MSPVRKALIIKTSSMGDVIHTFPALTDATNALPNIRFDWVVEEGFAEIPHWHPAVERVIPIALRRWRKNPLQAWRSRQWQCFRKELKFQGYDAVIDAQGLIKSAFLTCLIRGKRFGLDKHSAREPLAARFYHCPQNIPKGQHAVERIRQLFALSLNYPLPHQKGQFQLDKTQFAEVPTPSTPYLVFVHSTSRDDKLWPEPCWCELAKTAIKAGYHILLPWGAVVEKERAKRLADTMNSYNITSKDSRPDKDWVTVLPKLTLSQMAATLAEARAVVAVDTGLGHLAAALEVPSVSLYGPTSPILVGTYGNRQVHLTPADGSTQSDKSADLTDMNPFRNITPKLVWQHLKPLLDLELFLRPEQLQ
ncbi:Lipopolysaccharide heptosyltransferase 1 [invertebrate metagenome]|uniref:Lipopolysaccharide heptosyltransferase 1 n=1 Tax=invertebrate metagenome TaxID=1711999 RepID=A0A2H9T640_9ZZZZ